jgi:hypothetical protein
MVFVISDSRRFPFGLAKPILAEFWRSYLLDAYWICGSWERDASYVRDQNSPRSPCRANVASASAAPARSQSELSRVAYQSRPNSKTVCGDSIAPS